MARFKKAKRYVRRATGFLKRKSRSKSGSSGVSPMKLALTGAVYGAGRPYVANMIPDIPQLGGYSDNLILGGAGWAAAKYGSGMVKTAGLGVLTVEAFLAGSKASSGIMGGQTSGIFIN